LRPAGDGKPRLFVLRDTLSQRDERLTDAKLPACTAEEIDGYIWDTSGSRQRGEQPLKIHDHGMDCIRYLVMHFDGRGSFTHNLIGQGKFGCLTPGMTFWGR